ncbi:MAG: TolB protein [Myxococcota bacterium]|jgi:TolB protein
MPDPSVNVPGMIRAACFSALCAFLLVPAVSTAQPTGGESLFDDEGLPRVVVAPSQRKRDRIAVPSVRCAGAGAVCDEVNKQLARNLELSTLFEVLNSSTFVANMDQETLTETSWPDWFNVGSRYLIKGRISGAGPYQVELRFYNVVEKKVVPVKGQSHRGIARKAVHGAVNAFLNGIIESQTGVAGPFGSHIVYAVKTTATTRGIGIMEMDGHNRRGIAGGDSINLFPKFAGNGVLYTSFKPGHPQLYVGKKRLTHDSYHYRGASYGPGGQLAASLSMGSGSDIYLLSAGGKVLRSLTRGGMNVSPTWSPDGSEIAFVSDRAGGPQVYVMSSGGGSARRLTMAGAYNSTPHWGKNNQIAFAGMTATGSDIFTVDTSGNIQRITQDQGTNTDPCWSPDGRYLAFVSMRKGQGKRIWIASQDGRWQFPVSTRSGGYSTPRWGK